MEDKVLCHTPTPGKTPTRIDRWKYDLVHDAILAALGDDPDGVEFMHDLPARVSLLLPAGELARLGSLMWYITTVKLDMEVRGEIERLPGAKPQRLRKN